MRHGGEGGRSPDVAEPPLFSLDGMSASALAQWIHITSLPDNRLEVIRLLEETASIMRGEVGKSAVASIADKYISRGDVLVLKPKAPADAPQT